MMHLLIIAKFHMYLCTYETEKGERKRVGGREYIFQNVDYNGRTNYHGRAALPHLVKYISTYIYSPIFSPLFELHICDFHNQPGLT